MKTNGLRFKWDPNANKQITVKSRKKKIPEKMKSLEDYFDFIEQFRYSSDESKPDQHVDKKFSLSF